MAGVVGGEGRGGDVGATLMAEDDWSSITLRGLTFRAAGAHPVAMIVLALDTASRPASFALLAESRVLAARQGDPAAPSSTQLPGELAALVREAGLSLRDVDLFGVAVGPGSFTGLRVGIATVQGLALVARRPVVPVTTLDAWAWLAGAPGASDTAVWVDAQRGEVYAAWYPAAQPDAPADRLPRPAEPPDVGPPEAILDAWRPRFSPRAPEAVFVGDGAARYADTIRTALGARARVLVLDGVLAVAIGEVALRRAARGETVPPHAIVPVYVRRPDAELARERREGPAGQRAAPVEEA
jgi:tRNA threonylcarbamoyladenosine biosynthesis protein TsaB